MCHIAIRYNVMIQLNNYFDRDTAKCEFKVVCKDCLSKPHIEQRLYYAYIASTKYRGYCGASALHYDNYTIIKNLIKVHPDLSNILKRKLCNQDIIYKNMVCNMIMRNDRIPRRMLYRFIMHQERNL
jgi:hypothetical protein